MTTHSAPLCITSTAADGSFYCNPAHFASAALQKRHDFAANHGLTPAITLHQVHSTDIITVTPKNAAHLAAYPATADGLFTTMHGIALGILTADCLPILLSGTEGYALLHAGRRGLLAGIIQKALPLVGTLTSVHIGPHAQTYEVRSDVWHTVDPRFLEQHPDPQKRYLHLAALAASALPPNIPIVISPKDTLTDLTTLSYRRHLTLSAPPPTPAMLTIAGYPA